MTPMDWCVISPIIKCSVCFITLMELDSSQLLPKIWNWGSPNVVGGFTTPACRHQDYNNDRDNLSEMNNTVPHKKRGTKLPLLHPAPASEKFKTFQLVHFLTVFFGGVWFQILPETENLETYYICTRTPTNRPQKSISHIFHISWATRANWIELSEKYPWAQIWGFCGSDLDHKSGEFWQRKRRRGAGGIAIQEWLYKFYKKELLVCSRARSS